MAEIQAEELAKDGNQVAIFAFGADIKPKRADLFIMGMPKNLFWQRIYRLIFPLDIIKVCKWLPRLKNFDLIIAHLYPLTWLAYLAKKLYKVKYTFWYHGIVDPQFFPHLYERIYLRLQIFFTRLTVQNADRAVAVSKFSQQELKKYTGLDSEVIYNKVDLDKFHPGIDGSRIRQKHSLADDPVILFVGRISPHKGVHQLIQAFNSVKEKITNAKLIIVGRPEYTYYFNALKRMSDDSVVFTGPVSHDFLPLYYAACDVYASCSRWETYNLPLVEAQACRKPVVAFNVGPHPEVVTDGETGFLVPFKDADALAEAIIKLLKNDKLRQEMGGNAYKAAGEKVILGEYRLEKLAGLQGGD
ncbi:MAG: glycosyltransferase family 4 protein [Dehalococcoidia bacterium]|nr:glycosyltransferase family 4 protein [Dehalococcoidia bacterium]